MRLALPNFEALATLCVQGRVELKEIILAIHGGQDYEYNYYYSSWNFTSLSKILSENGFEDVKRTKLVNFCLQIILTGLFTFFVASIQA